MGLITVAALLVAAPANADPDMRGQCTVTNSGVKEASGLAMSRRLSNVAYVVNDDVPLIVYGIRLSDCAVVSKIVVRNLKSPQLDTEALSVGRDGRLWIADTGDNKGSRTTPSLIAFPEPGAGYHEVTSFNRYYVRYPGGAHLNVETMLVRDDGLVFLVEKSLDGHVPYLYALPATLRNNAFNAAKKTTRTMPRSASDGTFTPDYGHALIRTPDNRVYVYRTTRTGWMHVDTWDTPGLEKSEGITVALDGSAFFVGSEGVKEPILTLQLPLN